MVQIQIKPEKYGTADLIIDMCVYFNLRPDELYCLCHNSRPLAAGSPENGRGAQILGARDRVIHDPSTAR